MGRQRGCGARRNERMRVGGGFADVGRSRSRGYGPKIEVSAIEVSAAEAGVETRFFRRQISTHALAFELAAARPRRLAMIVVRAVVAAAEPERGVCKTARLLRPTTFRAATIALVRMMPATSKHRMDEEQNRGQI